MKHDQVKYASRRLDEMHTEKDMAIRKDCTDKSKSLTANKLLSLIKNGKVKLWDHRDEAQIERYTDISSIFNIQELLDAETFDKEAYEKRSKALRKSFIEVKDELILGDEKRALALIEAFAKKDF